MGPRAQRRAQTQNQSVLRPIPSPDAVWTRPAPARGETRPGITRGFLPVSFQRSLNMALTPGAVADVTDARLSQLHDWLSILPATHGLYIDMLQPASADASFHRYLRLDDVISSRPGTLVVVGAPPPQEDCRLFVHVAGLLNGVDMRTPLVLERDLAQSFSLPTDLGPQIYLQSLRERDFDLTYANTLSHPATRTLVR